MLCVVMLLQPEASLKGTMVGVLHYNWEKFAFTGIKVPQLSISNI